jgi:hypothetical protein
VSISQLEAKRRQWTIAVVGGDTNLGFEEWMEAKGVGTPTLHRPPRMEDDNGLVDGVFVFYNTEDKGSGQDMEVVPMTTGNVEFTISGGLDGGLVFNLKHCDRADLIRALLHDFHYSREIGGPQDDD